MSLVGAVVLFFVGAFLFEVAFLPMAFLYVLGRGIFVVWCVVLAVAVVDYYRKIRKMRKRDN